MKTRTKRAAAPNPYEGIDFRKHPERYRLGRGEQGVLTAQPYKSELLPLWRFRTEAIAQESSRALVAAFYAYRDAGDFIGMDLARKFLQMGFTRARRYANHRSGRKYAADGSERRVDGDADGEKARAAVVFRAAWVKVNADTVYQEWRATQRRVRGSTRTAP